MKVELNIETSQLGDTIIDVFKNFTKKEKKEMAEKVLMKWLTEPYEIERSIKIADAIKKIKDKGDTIYSGGIYKKPSLLTDEQIADTNECSREMENFKSSRDIMIEEITSEAIKHYKKIIPEKIENDKQLEKVMKATTGVIKEDFPKFVHDAMIAWFAHNMSSMANGINTALQQSSNAEAMAKGIAERTGINQY